MGSAERSRDPPGMLASTANAGASRLAAPQGQREGRVGVDPRLLAGEGSTGFDAVGIELSAFAGGVLDIS